MLANEELRVSKGQHTTPTNPKCTAIRKPLANKEMLYREATHKHATPIVPTRTGKR